MWLADLDSPAAARVAADSLTDDERDRAAAILGPRERRRWRASRSVLRSLLGEYLGPRGSAAPLRLGPHGKPALADPPPDLRFNVAHAGPLALFGFCEGFELGVDIETLRPALDSPSLARRLLGEAGARRVLGLGAPDRRRELARAWVREESILKCRGDGLRGRALARPAPSAGLTVIELDVGRLASASLAVALEDPCVLCLRWQARRVSDGPHRL